MRVEANEVRTLAEYKAVAGHTVGVVAVTDTATGNKVHRLDCAHVSAETFNTKVIEHANRNGRYYFYLRTEDAELELRASRCQKCH
jgi:hypothetical protein